MGNAGSEKRGRSSSGSRREQRGSSTSSFTTEPRSGATTSRQLKHSRGKSHKLAKKEARPFRERPPVGESQSVKALESIKLLVQGCLNGVTNSSKNHCQFCFSWPSIHLFATLGKQMHFGFPFGGRAAGVAYSAATRQGNTCSKCDEAHKDSPTQHTRCMIRTQRKACSAVVGLPNK